MLTNNQTREVIRKMYDCGIKIITIKEECGIDHQKFDNFLYRNGKLDFKNLIVLLAYVEFAFPWFLEELEDTTNYGSILEVLFFDTEDNKNE